MVKEMFACLNGVYKAVIVTITQKKNILSTIMINLSNISLKTCKKLMVKFPITQLRKLEEAEEFIAPYCKLYPKQKASLEIK